jgi:hypothetical protein
MKLLRKVANVIERLKENDLNFFEEQFRYGHREILLSYSINQNMLIGRNSILSGGLEHGWAPGTLRWVSRKRNLSYAQRYLWHERRLIAYKKKENAIAVGAPWLYMLTDLGLNKETILEKLPKKHNKIVILPSHHTLVPINIDIIGELERIKEVIPQKSDVTVCLFWLDFCNPTIRRNIEEKGWKVFSAGIVSDKPYHDTNQGGRSVFLLELFTLLKDAERIIISSAGTSMFYGLSLGAKVQFLQSEHPIDHWGSPDKGMHEIVLPGFYDSYVQWIRFEFPELLDTEKSPKQFIEKAWQELGVKSLKENLKGNKFKWITAEVNPFALSLYQLRLNEVKVELNSI